MADNDKPDFKDVLKSLKLPPSPLPSMKPGEVPKPMLLGTLLPKTPSGPPNFTTADVINMLKEINVKPGKVYTSPGGATYINYKVPGQPAKSSDDFGGQPPQIRIPGKGYKASHAGSPFDLNDPEMAGMNFIDTAGKHTGASLPNELYGKFIKNEQGDYYNTLPAVRNAVLWRTGQGLVPPGTQPNMPKLPEAPVKLPPDPNQLDFMHKLYENHGTQRLDNIAGGNPENLLSSNQMKQRFNLDTTKDFGMGMLPSVRRGQNESPPLLPGGNTGIQGTFNEKYIQLMRLLEKSKEPPPDAGQ